MNDQDASSSEAKLSNSFTELATWAKLATEERKRAADMAFEVAKAERARTALRFKITAALIQTGASKTAAADAARIDPEYAKAGEDIDELINRWEHAYADAVGSQNAVSLAIGHMGYQQGGMRARIELKAVQDFVEHHVRSLG